MKVDRKFGHIVVTANPRADAAFVDLGPVLHWWAYLPIQLDPHGARELATALIAWADRRDPDVTSRPGNPTGGA